MLKVLSKRLVLACAATGAILTPSSRAHAAAAQNPAQAPAVTRTVLLQHDLPIPGYSMVLVAVEIPAGGREGRHTHPGSLVAHVDQGSVRLDYDGNPSVTYKTGESFFVESGKIHEGINAGTTPVKLLATFVVETGKPLASQVP